ncbi:hypothetical protein F66182_8665 [Fusarium sp. NRRL 66182]|nr:hypothetical protein F66182_8665 [Fusarium sp. NRRL 66182]
MSSQEKTRESKGFSAQKARAAIKRYWTTLSSNASSKTSFFSRSKERSSSDSLYLSLKATLIAAVISADSLSGDPLLGTDPSMDAGEQDPYATDGLEEDQVGVK